MEHFPGTNPILDNLIRFSEQINQIRGVFRGSSLEEVVTKLKSIDSQEFQKLKESLEKITDIDVLKNQIKAEILRLCDDINANRDINEFKSDIVTIFFAGLIEGIKTHVNLNTSPARLFYDAIIHFWESVVYFILVFVEDEQKWIFDARENMGSPIKNVLTAIYELISPLEKALGAHLAIEHSLDPLGVNELLEKIMDARQLLTESPE